MNDSDDDFSRFAWQPAEQRAAQGDSRQVADLALELTDRIDTAAKKKREHEHQLAMLVRVLAITPGHDSLTQLLRLFTRDRAPGVDLAPRFVASVLAEHREAADLVGPFSEHDAKGRLDELRFCLLHELILRDVDVDAFVNRRDWTRVLYSSHPLAWLPRHRTALETRLGFPSRSVNGSARSAGVTLPTEGRVDPPTPRTEERSALVDSATLDLHQMIIAAPKAGGWGYSEAWVFLTDEEVEPDGVPALLPTLPMECVEGLGATGRFEIARRPADEIWGILYATASMGGMYHGGAHGAYGRLWAWKSMAALSDAPAGASAEEVEQHIRQTTWFHFESDAEWFHNEACTDYGIAALSPDRRRIAVLAATDTD
ncbi:DUF6183 family protein [Streptomyces durocortorensis]|uniref:DUF1963 domain-containing protein n=1 Tax=Streptomyces durocortorensis TaxID=2811104 RepID=A0ABS2I3B4_9ACTN|nr:DUF6183 family protein [Streptomyces durocortorensis]MBM7056684.1 hypothetical protein [Streptomyces durocortorensis]